MFSYYGSKCKIAKYYPNPTYKTIIEPFAGAAWYSVIHNSHDIILNEKYELIYDLWNWLINDCKKEQIDKHKNFFLNEDISNIDINKNHKNLIGFCINRGSVSPRNIVQKWNCQVKSKPDWASTTYYQLDRVSKNLDKIKHWNVTFNDYKKLPNIEGTWFIDPPYQHGGNLYCENIINYKELADWCKSRKGQVIVCENSKADWLDFIPLVNITGQRIKSTECIYIKNN